MTLGNNIKQFSCLVLLTIVAIFSHYLGVFNTKYALYNDNFDPIELISLGDVRVSKGEQKGAHVVCQLDDASGYNLCGVGIGVGENDWVSGKNFNPYESIEFELFYKTPDDKSRLKISLRNHNKNYSKSSDRVSHKFNTITLDTSTFDLPIDVPLEVFQVETWWLSQYNVDFENSLSDFSNIIQVEFLTSGMEAEGGYEILVKSITLRGKAISFQNLITIIVCIWFFTGIYCIFRQQNLVKEISKKDMVTGLHNHIGFERIVQSRALGNNISMHYIGISELKDISDTYGYKIADEVAIYATNLIKEKLSKVQCESYLCRYSDDGFAILFENTNEEDLISFSKEITRIKKKIITIRSHKVNFSMYLGVFNSPDCTHDYRTLISHSRAAMNYSQQNNSLSFQVFDDEFSQEILQNKNISEYIKSAISNDEFTLNFMPIYKTETLEVSAMEVLLRTNSESLIGIGPDVFIPIAEKFNLIKEIDAWVIENTLSIIKENYTYLEATKPIFCINISSEQLRNTKFVDLLSRLLKQYDIPAEWIELELTETSLVNVEDKNIEVLQGIRDLGVRLSLDDYGTGYISFNQLINYPVNNLKIDKSFIDLLENKDDASKMIVKSIHSLATTYQLTTVAEGVETIEQYHYLSELGCDFLQGYLFCKPVPWNQVKTLLDPSHIEEVREKLKEKHIER
ncbi:phosphodiesterase [Marinomonas sp. C2222]|uniref:Phosphodiesterase n=1 Tax=Marinomonas sargassi TaxID=2984494 RepID=A0ABT2YT62_9GAMM|nr:phosphodiesterase [Marinomonas sargassi]MCV2402950.1 phosphodiesterase [Marinomonas sargassi]